jgi:hypothetical protein
MWDPPRPSDRPLGFRPSCERETPATARSRRGRSPPGSGCRAPVPSRCTGKRAPDIPLFSAGMRPARRIRPPAPFRCCGRATQPILQSDPSPAALRVRPAARQHEFRGRDSAPTVKRRGTSRGRKPILLQHSVPFRTTAGPDRSADTAVRGLWEQAGSCPKSPTSCGRRAAARPKAPRDG